MKNIKNLIKRYDAYMAKRRRLNMRLNRPTSRSMQYIRDHFHVRFPNDFLLFAQESEFYGSWFASVGENYQDRNHIIRINSYWRRRGRSRKSKHRIPRNLIAFTMDFDNDLDCFDLSLTNDADMKAGNLSVSYWEPDLKGKPLSSNSFYDYMERTIQFWENKG